MTQPRPILERTEEQRAQDRDRKRRQRERQRLGRVLVCGEITETELAELMAKQFVTEADIGDAVAIGAAVLQDWRKKSVTA